MYIREYLNNNVKFAENSFNTRKFKFSFIEFNKLKVTHVLGFGINKIIFDYKALIVNDFLLLVKLKYKLYILKYLITDY